MLNVKSLKTLRQYYIHIATKTSLVVVSKSSAQLKLFIKDEHYYMPYTMKLMLHALYIGLHYRLHALCILYLYNTAGTAVYTWS